MDWTNSLREVDKNVEDTKTQDQKDLASYDRAENWSPMDSIDLGPVKFRAPVEWARLMEEQPERIDGQLAMRSSQVRGVLRSGGLSFYKALEKGQYGKAISSAFGLIPAMKTEDMESFIESNPVFIADPDAAGELQGYVNSVKSVLEHKGLKFDPGFTFSDVAHNSMAFIKSQLPGRFSGRLMKGDEQNLLNAVMSQEIIANSSLIDGPNLPSVIRSIRGAVSPAFRVPFEGTDQEFHASAQDLFSLKDSVEDMAAPYENSNFSRIMTVFNSEDQGEVARKWYTHLTGTEPTEDIKVNQIMGPINAYLNNYSLMRDKSLGAEKWKRAGVDIPLHRIHDADGRMNIGELPGAEVAAANYLKYYSSGMAFGNVGSHAEDYAFAQTKELLNRTKMADFIADSPVPDEDKQALISSYRMKLNVAKGNYITSAGLIEEVDDANTKWRIIRGLAFDRPWLRGLLATNKQTQRLKYINENNTKRDEDRKLNDIDDQSMSDFIQGEHRRYAATSDTERKKQEKYAESYLIKYNMQIIGGIGSFINTMTGGETGKNLLSPLYHQLLSSQYDYIPASERVSMGLGGRSIVDNWRDTVGKLLPVLNESNDEMMDKYLDKAAVGEAGLMDELGLVFKMNMRGFLELPFMAMENPAQFAVFAGALKTYSKATRIAGRDLAKATHMPIIEAFTGFVARPHDFLLNSTAAVKGGMSTYLKFGMTTGKIRKFFNGMPSGIRGKYIEALNKIDTTVGKLNTKEIGGCVHEFNAALGSLLSRAEGEYKLSRMDIRKLGTLATELDVPYEATNVMMGGIFGGKRMYNGAISNLLNSAEYKHWSAFEESVKQGKSPLSEMGKSPMEALRDVEGAYAAYKWKSVEDRAGAAKALLGNRGYSNKAIDWAVDKFFAKRLQVEQNSLFNTEATELAMKENFKLVQKTETRVRVLDGTQKALEMSIEHSTMAIRNIRKMMGTEDINKKIRADYNTEIKNIETSKQAIKGIKLDKKKLRILGKSRLVNKLGPELDPMFSDIENGWASNVAPYFKNRLISTMVNAARHDERVAEQLTRVAIGKTKEVLKGAFDPNKSRDKAVADVLKSNFKQDFFKEGPPQSISNLIANQKNSFKQILDVIRGQTRTRRGRHEMSESMAGLLGAVGSVNNRKIRLMGQRVESLSQGVLAKLTKLEDASDQVSNVDHMTLSKYFKKSRAELDALPDSKVKTIAIGMSDIRDQILDAAVDVGKITTGEAKAMKAKGWQPNFFAAEKYRMDLSKLESGQMTGRLTTTGDVPLYRNLHEQQKPHTARVSYADRSNGKWTIKDFGPENGFKTIKDANRAAKAYRDGLVKSKQVNKRDIRVIDPLTDESMAVKGLIKDDASYHFTALQGLVTDIAQTKLMNEVGLMRGIVRTNLDKVPLKERSKWFFVGDDNLKGTVSESGKPQSYRNLPLQVRRDNQYRWGAMAGKYVHGSFFDSINSMSDYVSTIGRIAESFKDTIAASRQDTDSAMMKISNAIRNNDLMVGVDKVLRRTLIAMNPVSYMNNFMSAVNFSHMAGADVHKGRFWKGYTEFNKLFNALGTEKIKDMEDGELFMFAVKNGIIERIDESVGSGGKIHLTAKKAGSLSDVFNWNKHTAALNKKAGKKVKKLQRKVDNIRRMEDDINTLLFDTKRQRIRPEVITQLNETKAKLRTIRKDLEGDIVKGVVDGDLMALRKLPKRAMSYAEDWVKGVLGDPDSVIGEAFSQAYGSIDPKLKWATLRDLTVNKGYSKEAALQMVLDLHQNYGAVSPLISQIKRVPIAGAFVPSFPAEAARMISNGLKHSPARTTAPIWGTQLWNTGVLASQGLDPSDMGNMFNTEDSFDMFRVMSTMPLFPAGNGEVYAMDATNFSPWSPMFESTGGTKLISEHVTPALKPLLNYAGNFVFNTPGTSLAAKYVMGVNSHTGEVTYRGGDFGAVAANVGKDAATLFLPKIFTRPYQEYQRYKNTPASLITKRNVTLIDAAMRSVGIKLDRNSNKQKRAYLALSYLNEDIRSTFIKDFITREPEFMRDVYMMKDLKFGSQEYRSKLEALVDIETDRFKGKITIGNQTFDANSTDAARQKAARSIINMTTKNIEQTIESINPSRRVPFLRALYSTWGKDNVEYKHALRTVTDPNYTESIQDIVAIQDLFIAATNMRNKTLSAEFRNDMSAVSASALHRGFKLMRGSRRADYVSLLMNSTEGKRDRKMSELFARQIGLLR
jgi:hypothetical protein